MPQTTTLTYLLSDHLGSTSVAVDSVTGEAIETLYKPWGEVRWTTENKTLPTRYTFTGQYSYIADDATDIGSAGFGLMLYNARWYDPSLGRFAQADTIIPSSQGTQAWDRYAYVNNNPVRYNDPTGHVCSDPEDPTPECEKPGNGATGGGGKPQTTPPVCTSSMCSGNGQTGGGSGSGGTTTTPTVIPTTTPIPTTTTTTPTLEPQIVATTDPIAPTASPSSTPTFTSLCSQLLLSHLHKSVHLKALRNVCWMALAVICLRP